MARSTEEDRMKLKLLRRNAEANSTLTPREREAELAVIRQAELEYIMHGARSTLTPCEIRRLKEAAGIREGKREDRVYPCEMKVVG